MDGTNAAALAALRGLFTNPQDYYVNIHTTDIPGGIMRGQLQPAIGTVLMGVMSSDNEVPVQTPAASGMALVVALATLNANGGLATGVTYQSINYNSSIPPTSPACTSTTARPASTARVVINTGIPTTTLVDPNGNGVSGPYYTEIDLTNAAQVATFANLFSIRSADYINIHTNCPRRRRHARPIAAHRQHGVPDHAGFGQ